MRIAGIGGHSRAPDREGLNGKEGPTVRNGENTGPAGPGADKTCAAQGSRFGFRIYINRTGGR